MAFKFTHEGVAMRVQVNSLLARVVGKDAITIWNTMFFYGKKKGVPQQQQISGYLLAHEWRHVKQWKTLGFWGFIWTYSKDMWDGYQLTDALEAEGHQYGLENALRFEPYAKAIRNH